MTVEETRIAKEFVDQNIKSLSLIELCQSHSARNHTACKIINKQKSPCNPEETQGKREADFSFVIRARVSIDVQVLKA